MASRTPRFQRPTQPLPADVRWMNAAASAVFVLLGVAALAGAGVWLLRTPAFPIRSIQLSGDLARNSVPAIRANAAPRLAGNFFSVDLQAARSAFEAVPWVRHAIVRRVWPDHLAVQLEEHRTAALWEGDDGNEKLVNSYGEVFEANVGDVEDDSLPTFSGPEGESAAMLALYRRLQPVLEPLQQGITRLELSGRGSWRAELDSGATLEMGRGSEDELLARVQRFAHTLPGISGPGGRWTQPLEYADLRHADGYAVRLRGVSTTTAAAAGKTRN